jgi:hypothetical protein
MSLIPYQIVSSLAFTAPLNAIGITAITWAHSAKNGKYRALITGAVAGIYFGTLPSLVLELGRMGANQLAPELSNWVPAPISNLVFAAAHVALPLIFIKFATALPGEINQSLTYPFYALVEFLAPLEK